MPESRLLNGIEVGLATSGEERRLRAIWRKRRAVGRPRAAGGQAKDRPPQQPRRFGAADPRPVARLQLGCERPPAQLGRLQVGAAKAARVLTGGRLGGRLGDGPQVRSSLIGVQLLDVGEEVAALQLGLGERDHVLTRAEAAAAGLDRVCPRDLAELGVDQLDEAEPAAELAREREARMGGQGGIVGANLKSSGGLPYG